MSGPRKKTLFLVDDVIAMCDVQCEGPEGDVCEGVGAAPLASAWSPLSPRFAMARANSRPCLVALSSCRRRVGSGNGVDGGCFARETGVLRRRWH